MNYVSTRGTAPALNFEGALLAGLARDGGLYVPDRLPRFAKKKISAFAGAPYQEVAQTVMQPFVDKELSPSEFRTVIDEAYATFSHSAVAPLVQLEPGHFVLELFHGTTLAFKDVAMQLLARLMDRALLKRGQRATVIGATSGDTGSAAIDAFRGRETIDIFILHPHGRTSDVQRRQMTSVRDANVHNVAVEGTFDDCQNLVKALFNDHKRRDRLALAGVNSINWARIMAQMVYYFTSAVAIGAPHRSVSFTVPTGNFGDILAGYYARQMGLPIDRLTIATNRNDILARVASTGRYEPADVAPSHSPSMDIQISSNFERLLFDLTGRDSGRVNALMNSLGQSGAFSLSDDEQTALRDIFSAHRTDEQETEDTIGRIFRETGYVLDPHTAVGVAAAQKEIARGISSAPMITLATAHPAKFPAVVTKATGIEPAIPRRLAAQMGADERYAVLPNDFSSVTEFIEARARVLEPTA